MASCKSCSSDEDLKSYEDAENNLMNSKLFILLRKDGMTEHERIRELDDCLAEGAEVNCQNIKGKTILHLAVEKMLTLVIDFLLISGASPDIKNVKNKTAIDIAKELKLNEILQKLQKYSGSSLSHGGSSSLATQNNGEKLERFVSRFVKEFETKFEVFHAMLEGITKPKAGKFSDTFARSGQMLGSYFGGEAGGILLGAITEKLGQTLGENSYKKKVKSLRELVYSCMSKKDNFRNTLIEAGFQIFRNFELVVMNVTSSSNWRAVINKLAEDAVNRAINYIATEGIEEINEDAITKGVVYGESKRNILGMKCGFRIHYQVVSSNNIHKIIVLETAKIYSKSGMRIVDGASVRYYRYKRNTPSRFHWNIRGNKANKYYYRLPFNWELKDLEDKLKTYYEKENALQFKSMFESRDIEVIKNELKFKINKSNEQLTTDWMESSINELKCDLLKRFQKIVETGNFGIEDKDLLETIENVIKELNIKENIDELKNVTVEKGDEIKEVVKFEGNLTREANLRQHEITRSLIVQNFEEFAKRGTNVLQEMQTSNISFDVLEPVLSFIERNETELQDIHKLFNQPQNKGEQNNMYSRMVVISGFGGLGKSELARKYAKVYGEYYDNVVWLNSTSYETLKASFIKLAKTMKADDYSRSDVSVMLLANLIYKHLCKENCVSLFIFDNAEKLKSQSDNSGIFNFLPFSLSPNLIKPHVIITTQRTDWDRQIKQIKLEPLKDKGAELLKKLLPEDKVQGQEKYVEDLTKTLGYLPLAIQLAASYIHEHDMTVEQYFSEYDERKNDLLIYEFPEGSADNYTMTLFRTWSMAFDRIRNNEKENAAVRVLYAFAFMVPDKSVESMKAYFDKDIEIHSAIQTLRKYSLLNDNLQMNNLMQEVVRIQLSETEHVEVLERLLRNMVGKKEELQKNEEALQHANYIWNSAISYKSLIEKFYEFPLIFVTNGQSALHYACSQGHIKVIQFLLQKKKVNVYAKDSAGKTALHRAAEAGRIDVVKYLTEKEPELIKVKDTYHGTALYRANQQTGNIDIILHLLEKNLEEDDEENKHWWKFLAKAAKENKREIVRYLIYTSPDFEQLHYDKLMFLNKAAQDGELDVVKYLVDVGGMNITEGSTRQVTVLHEAVSGGNSKVIQFILNKLEEMFTYEKEKLIYYVNARDIGGDTPLMWAAQGGKVEAIRLLKKSGADVNIKNSKGKTALGWVKEEDLTDEVKDLLSHNTHSFYAKSKNER